MEVPPRGTSLFRGGHEDLQRAPTARGRHLCPAPSHGESRGTRRGAWIGRDRPPARAAALAPVGGPALPEALPEALAVMARALALALRATMTIPCRAATSHQTLVPSPCHDFRQARVAGRAFPFQPSCTLAQSYSQKILGTEPNSTTTLLLSAALTTSSCDVSPRPPQRRSQTLPRRVRITHLPSCISRRPGCSHN